MNIHYYPHPILNHKCKPLQRVDAALLEMIDEARKLMVENGGIGLAANQVGLPYKFFITGYEEIPVIINPVVFSWGEKIERIESCLSIPDFEIRVKRAKYIKINGYSEKGETIDLKLSDDIARCCLHEMEHLEGFTLLKHLNSTKIKPDITSVEKLIVEFVEPPDWVQNLKELEDARC